MTWTYDNTDPSASDTSEVRFWSQLTDTNDQRLTDEEIDYIITLEDTNVGAAARCCEILATRYAGEVDTKTGAAGEFSIKASQLSAQFAKRAADLRREAAKHASPWAASISVTEKDAQEADTDRVEPAFTRDQFNGIGGSNTLSPEWDSEGYR